MDITINYSTLYNKVARSLSVIGKRIVDENGNTLFGDITLSSRETEIMTDFFKQAVIAITAETASFVSGSKPNTSITLTFPDNHNRDLDPFIQDACDEYCVSYALYSWFVVTEPKIAEKYNADSVRQLAVINRHIHEKNAPSAPVYRYPTAININFPVIGEQNGFPGFITPDNSPTVDPLQLFSSPLVMTVGSESEISYSLTGEDGVMPEDDIVVRCDNPCCQPFLTNGIWNIRGISTGVTIVTLFSRHNDKVFANFAVQITP